MLKTALAFLLLTGTAFAAAPGFTHLGEDSDVQLDLKYSAAYGSCMSATVGDMDMVECITEEHARWDRRLNAAYGKLRTKLDRETFADLQKAQRAWIAYRQADCEAAGNVVARGGTMGRVESNSCFLLKTILRVRDLEQLLLPTGN